MVCASLFWLFSVYNRFSTPDPYSHTPHLFLCVCVCVTGQQRMWVFAQMHCLIIKRWIKSHQWQNLLLRYDSQHLPSPPLTLWRSSHTPCLLTPPFFTSCGSGAMLQFGDVGSFRSKRTENPPPSPLWNSLSARWWFPFQTTVVFMVQPWLIYRHIFLASSVFSLFLENYALSLFLPLLPFSFLVLAEAK